MSNEKDMLLSKKRKEKERNISYIQEGQEASYDYLLLGVYHRNSPGATFTLVLLDRFLDGFSKFGFFIGEICILIRDF